MLITYTLFWPLATLVYLGKLLCLKYVLPTHNTLSAKKFIIFPETPNLPVIPVFILSPTHPFRSLSSHNLYLMLSHLQPCLSRSRSFPFLNITFQWGHTPPPPHTLTFENMNLTHRTLELIHPKSITALCHTSLAPSISCTPILYLYYSLSTTKLPTFPFNFFSAEASIPNLPFL